ncbi:MAG: DUF6906 family protein [Coprobacillaceae bacterium]
MRGKRLTVEMKKLLSSQGLNPDDYLYQKNTESFLQVCKKVDHKQVLQISKEV